MVYEDRISSKTAKQVVKNIYETNNNPENIIRELGLFKIKDSNMIENLFNEICHNFPKEFERLKNGDQKLISFFLGQIIKITNGCADTNITQNIIQNFIAKQ